MDTDVCEVRSAEGIQGTTTAEVKGGTVILLSVFRTDGTFANWTNQTIVIRSGENVLRIIDGVDVQGMMIGPTLTATPSIGWFGTITVPIPAPKTPYPLTVNVIDKQAGWFNCVWTIPDGNAKPVLVK